MPRPKIKPTQAQRDLVRSLVAFGVSQEKIARQIGIRSAKTLRKHFREELDRGELEANANVANAAYKMATSGQHPVITIFWMKCRAGWREQRDFQATPGAPPPFIVAKEEAA
jgi:hypothetical protein